MRRELIFIFVSIMGMVRFWMSRSETLYKVLFLPGLEGFRWQVGRWKAWYVFEHARQNTPAYREFCAEVGTGEYVVPLHTLDPDLSLIPVTNKENYVKKYSIEARCVGGKLPARGVVIDESSGTSGTPNNWVRGASEREAIQKIVQLSLHSLVGQKPIFVINAFALGPWATGMNVSMSLVDVSVMKSTGPDVAKIISTLKLFGPQYRYLLCGYPPFLKMLVDNKEIDWQAFDIIAVYGGESMTESVRTYLGQYFTRIYGSYGASDLEINMATENDFTIALRQEIQHNPALRAILCKDNRENSDVLPMIFQYNPLDYLIETNADGELLVTLCRATNAAPKIRYNIHDLGHVVRYPEYQKAIAECKVPLLPTALTDLPLLFHYGRSDSSVSFYGCKITPTNIQDVLYTLTALNAEVASFSLITYEDTQKNKRLILALELLPDRLMVHESILLDWQESVFTKLKEINQDFRESIQMVPDACKPGLEVYLHKNGPFENQDIRVKRAYIIHQ